MTFAMEEPGEILSQDAQGRVLVSQERREPLLAEYDRSGMSGISLRSTWGSNTPLWPTGSKAGVVIERSKRR
jgi:hypothetical protein